MKRSALSCEYVLVPVTALIDGEIVDVSSHTVQMAFPVKAVAPSVWKAASWTTDPHIPGANIARCLVGPGGVITLTAGTYDVWVKVDASVEVPVRNVGRLIII